LSKMLSRGQADEKLYLSLEEAVNHANRERYNVFVMIDLMHSALLTIGDINRVLDPETKVVDEKAYERAASRIAKAKKLAAEDLCSKPLIFYTESMLGDFGDLIHPKTRGTLGKKLGHLKKMYEDGTYEQHCAAIEALEGALSAKELGLVCLLMDIRKAGEYCEETDPSRAPKFFRKIDDIIEAYRNFDAAKVRSLLDEIMPETVKLVDKHHCLSGEIYKDIRR
jgi:hypothetical protein